MSIRFIAVLLVLLVGLSARAQAQGCKDGWEVDKDALRQVFADMGRYVSAPEPVVINLQALGASAGQLVIVYSRKDLQCARQLYESQLAGSGTIRICKRPRC